MVDKPSVFISYSHKDAEWKNRFVEHLRVSVTQGHFVQWNDEQIGAGEDWYADISRAMEAASVGVFLVSAAFLASDFINKEEVPSLITRRKEAGLHIVPVYLRHCDVGSASWLTNMQMRPGLDQPVIRGPDHIVPDHVVDEEFSKIAKEIR